MKFIEWYYRVDALFQISDEEIDILLTLATNSTDTEMQAAAKPNGFIYHWKEMSNMRHLSRKGIVYFTATMQQLSKTTELLETDFNSESAKLHLQFQEILTHSSTKQERVMPKALC